MSRQSARRQKLRAVARDAGIGVRTGDSFQNFMTRTGVGAGSANDGAKYGFNPVSRNRVQLEFAYRSSWVVGQVVDTVAEDMTREGVEIQSDMEPDDLQRLEKEAGRMGVWPQLCEVVKWSRLYGGAIGVLMIDGQDLKTPLRMESVGKGQFRGVMPLDRWMVQPSLQDLVTDFGPELGKPRFYDVLPDASGLMGMRIHHSRVVRLDGIELPYWQRISENGWGQSVVERLWDRLVPFDSATAGAAQLVYKAHLRTIKIKGLRELISVGGKAFDGLVANIDMIRRYQSNEGLTLLDAEDEFQTESYTFTGLDNVLLQFGQQISGATGIPLVRLFGQSPAGLNATGESDLRNYYDNVRAQQEARLRAGVERIYGLLYRSVFGKEPPDDWDIEFSALWQMTDEQKATVTNQRTAAVVAAYDSQIIDKPTALRELRQMASSTGAWSNVSDELIKQAEDEPPPMAGEGLPGTPGAPGQEGKNDAGSDDPSAAGPDAGQEKARAAAEGNAS